MLRHQRDRKRAKLLQYRPTGVGQRIRHTPCAAAIRRGRRRPHRQAIDEMDQFFRSLGVGTRLSDYNIPADAAAVVAARLAKRG